MRYLYLISSLLFTCILQAQNTVCVSERYQQKIFSQVKKTSQILYGNANSYNGIIQPQQLYLDFYEPQGDNLQHRPLIVYAFGGAFLIGDKNQPPIPRYCEDFAKMGYAVATIDYRIGFDISKTESVIRAVYRAGQDLRAAVRFLCQRADQYGIDTASVILTGSSAGCFSGLHCNYFEVNQRPPETYGIPSEPEDLDCFDCSVNADFGRRMPRIAGIINHWGAILDTALIDNEPDEDCPVISFHGTNDDAVPYTEGSPFSYPVFPSVHGSKLIHKRLTSLGIPNNLCALDGEGHEPWLLKPSLVDTMESYTVPFLYDEVLRPKPQKITGDSLACKGQFVTIKAIQRDRSIYCWNISSPKVSIINISGNEITLKCVDTGSVHIKLIEKNYLDAASKELEFVINILNKPKAGFSVQNTNKELEISIADNAQNNTATLWNLGNGQTQTGKLNNYTYAKPGTYSILQTVSNAACSDTFSRFITVDTCPVAYFTYKILTDSLLLFADTTNAVNYEWNIDGSNFSGQNIIVKLFGNNILHVRLTVANQLGCTDNLLQFISKEISDVNDDFANSGVRVYPNPFRNEFVIDAPDNTLLYYELLDVSGRKISAKTISGKTKIELQGQLKNGFYLLKIFAPGWSKNFSLIGE